MIAYTPRWQRAHQDKGEITFEHRENSMEAGQMYRIAMGLSLRFPRFFLAFFKGLNHPTYRVDCTQMFDSRGWVAAAARSEC